MRKTFLFDMDGVLIDSEPICLDYLIITIHQFGAKAELEDLQFAIGRDRDYIANKIINQYNLSTSVEEFLYKYAEIRGNFYASSKKLKLFEGALECINLLKNKGCMMGLVSSSDSLDILYALNRFSLTNSFDVIVSGEMVKRAKPAPEPYLLAAELLRIPLENCIVIEDSFNGIKSAKSARMTVVAMEASSIKQNTSSADYIVESFEVLQNLIKAELWV